MSSARASHCVEQSEGEERAGLEPDSGGAASMDSLDAHPEAKVVARSWPCFAVPSRGKTPEGVLIPAASWFRPQATTLRPGMATRRRTAIEGSNRLMGGLAGSRPCAAGGWREEPRRSATEPAHPCTAIGTVCAKLFRVTLTALLPTRCPQAVVCEGCLWAKVLWLTRPPPPSRTLASP